MKTYGILDKEIRFTDSQMNYFYMYERYIKMGKIIVKEMKSDWKKAGNINNVVANYETDIQKHIETIITKTISFLEEMKIYSYSAEMLFKEVSNYIDEIYDDFDEKVIEPYEEIQYSKEAIEQYRKSRKKNRTKYKGYGWDMSSKIANSAKAMSVNAVTGIGHSAVNMAGNAMSSVAAAAKKSSLYKNTSILEQLCDDMVELVDAAFSTVIKVSTNSGYRYTIVSSDDKDKARAITENIISGKIPEDNVSDYVKQSLSIWPYQDKLYGHLIKKYGDGEGLIQKIAVDFDFDATSYKQKIVDEKYSDILNRQFTDEEELLTIKREIEDFVAFLGTEGDKYIKNLDEKWCVIDRNIRTVEGIEYITREEANDVRADIVLFDTMVSNIKFEERNMLDEEEYQTGFSIVQNAEYKNASFKEHLRARYEKVANKAVELQKVYDKIRDNDIIRSVKEMIEGINASSVIGPLIRLGYYKNEEKKVFETGLIGLPILYVNYRKTQSLSKLLVLTTRQIAVLTRTQNKIISLDYIDEIVREEEKVLLVKSDGNTLELCEFSKIEPAALNEFLELLSNIIKSLKRLNIREYEKAYQSLVYCDETTEYEENDWTIIKNLKFNPLGLTSAICTIVGLLLGGEHVILASILFLAAIVIGIGGCIPVKWNRLLAVIGIVAGGCLLMNNWDNMASALKYNSHDESSIYEQMDNQQYFKEDFIGVWDDMYSQRCVLEIDMMNDSYIFTVNWSSTASENTYWRMCGEFVEGENKFIYSDGYRSTEYWDEDGNVSTTVDYEDGTGEFILKDGYMYWTDNQDPSVSNCIFAIRK